MTEAWEWAECLDGFLPYAPRGVAALIQQALDENPRLQPLERSYLHELSSMARTIATKRPHRGFQCSFPLVFQRGPTVPDGLDGAVLDAAAFVGPVLGCLDATSAEQALEDHELTDIVADHLSEGGVSLLLSPHPADQPEVRLRLRGPSAGGALYLAATAARQGTVVPPDVVISAALMEGPGGLWLGPVEACDLKRRVLERERPGCRFFYVPHDDEVVAPSAIIQLVPLEPGLASGLYERIFLRPPGQGDQAAVGSIYAQLDTGRSLFFDQRYPEAQAHLRAVVERLDAKENDGWHPHAPAWRYEAHARLAAISMHAGRWEAAEAVLDQLHVVPKEHEQLTRLLLVEVLGSVAGVRIDAFDPGGARRVLEGEQGAMEGLAALGVYLHREDALALVSYYGAWRRLHLLAGEPERAVEVQRALCAVAPGRQRARSLSDLGECLHRVGRFGEAQAVWGNADDLLGQDPAYRSTHTKAFLEFYRGRAALMSGAGDVSPVRISQVAGECLQGIYSSSAAAWRLEQLRLLAQLASGDEVALQRLGELAGNEGRTLVRWYRALDLLRGAQLCPVLAAQSHAVAAAVMERHSFAHYPALERARRAFCCSARRGGAGREAIEVLLSRRAY